jgi:hypothetical protein
VPGRPVLGSFISEGRPRHGAPLTVQAPAPSAPADALARLQIFDFRCTQSAELAPVLLLLRPDPPGGDRTTPAAHCARCRRPIQADAPRHASPAQRASATCSTRDLLHALVLLRMGAVANLTRPVRCLAVVVLPQLQSVPCRSLHQMFATPLEQARIGWMNAVFARRYVPPPRRLQRDKQSLSQSILGRWGLAAHAHASTRGAWT